MVRTRSHSPMLSGCLCVALLGGATLSAQDKERSHVERFASPKAQLERTVHDAAARLRKNPDDSKALEERGMAEVQLGDTTRALEDLRRAASIDSTSSVAYSNLAYALWIARRLPEALDASRTALKLDANNSAAHYYAARLTLETGGSLDEAITHFEKAIELNPEEIGFRFDLLNAYRERGDFVRAEAQLRLLRVALPPNDARFLYAQGLLAADLDHLSLAIDNFRQAVQVNPRFNPARLDLGMALIKAERWQEAADSLGSLAKDLPQSYPAAYFHALALQNAQHAAAAEQEIRRAIGLRPQSAEALTLLGILLSERAAYTDSVRALQEAVRLEPASFDAQFYLGRAHYAQNNYARARDAFQAAGKLKPDDLESRFFLATTLESMGETDAAVTEYRALTAQHPDDPRGFIGLGNVLAKHGQVDDAAKALERARQLDPKNFEASLDLGRVLLRQGKVDEAIGLLASAVERAPQSTDAHYQLGLALRRAGREQEAAAQFAIVEQLNKEQRNGPDDMAQPPGHR